MKAHSWDVSIPEATIIQKELRDSVNTKPFGKVPKTIAGADISFNRYSDIFHAGIVVLSYPSLEQIECSFFTMQVTFPYVSGYLSFREVPAIAEAFNRLKQKPDVLVMDGHGIAHPRRLGVATHLGLVLDTPTIGCAKSLLYGEGELPPEEEGSVSYLKDRKTGEVLGAYLRTKKKCKPVIISPGNRVSLEEALGIIRTCVHGYRIPEPTRRAHEAVNMFRRGEIRA